MKIKTKVVSLVIILVIFGGTGAAMAMNLWNTSNSKQPAKYKSGTEAGSYNPADIRGSYYISDIEKFFGIKSSIIMEAFGIEKDTNPDIFKVKDLESIYENSQVEIGNASVQVFVALYNNLPYTLGEDYLPTTATELIKANNKNLTAEQQSYLDKYTIDLSSQVTSGGTNTNTTSEDIEEGESNIVKGYTTFQMVLDAGITKQQIEQIINGTMPATNMTVRDYCAENDLSFSEVKDKLNALAN